MDPGTKARVGSLVQSRGGLPIEVERRLVAEEREPRANAAGGVVNDAVLAAAHARGRPIPEALGALVDEARRQLGG